ncbi:hypothetical protein A9Q99_10585 [Gammaproteobacteria bacterium 45_16_T64]|nr:hypothetical protein A9Q99_10585 [Gammaproteobacteria bacterium 45_16_T64]
MKTLQALNTTFRSLVVDGLSFVVALSLTFAGIWGLVQIEASFFTLVVFGVLMVPSLFSTATYLTRDINSASDRFIA